MAKIKLHDRVKLDDGRTGSIVYDDGSKDHPLLFVPDYSASRGISYLHRNDPRVTEIIGHRYFVDTPFTIGETYPTRDGDERTVIGVGLIVADGSGFKFFRNSDGTNLSGYSGEDLIHPSPEPETVTLKNGETYRVEEDLRLTEVEE